MYWKKKNNVDMVTQPVYKCGDIDKCDRIPLAVNLMVCLTESPFLCEHITFVKGEEIRKIDNPKLAENIDRDRTVLELITKLAALSDIVIIKGEMPARNGDMFDYELGVFIDDYNKIKNGSLFLLDAKQEERYVLKRLIEAVNRD